MAQQQQRRTYPPRQQPAKQPAPEPAPQQEQEAGRRPDIRIMQPEKDKDGNTVWNSVGGMWKTTSANGQEMYNVRIGNLRLVAFPNDPNYRPQQ